MSSKKSSNKYKQENIRFKTKILNLEKQISKYEKIVQELEQAGIFHNSINPTQINENMLVMSLRKRVIDLNEELKTKEEELALLKKTTKYTNHKILEVKQ